MPDLPDTVIQVVGDATVDWMLVSDARNQDRSAAAWETTTPVRIVAAPGGTAFLTDLLAQVCAVQQNPATRVAVHGITLSQQTMLDPQQSPLTRSFTVWDSFPVEVDSAQRASRIREFVGQEHGSPDNSPAEPPVYAASPTCLVIDDTNLGFRERPVGVARLPPRRAAAAEAHRPADDRSDCQRTTVGCPCQPLSRADHRLAVRGRSTARSTPPSASRCRGSGPAASSCALCEAAQNWRPSRG